MPMEMLLLRQAATIPRLIISGRIVSWELSLLNVVAGLYNITVTDAVGCTATNNVTITNTPAPTAVTTSNN